MIVVYWVIGSFFGVVAILYVLSAYWQYRDYEDRLKALESKDEKDLRKQAIEIIKEIFTLQNVTRGKRIGWDKELTVLQQELHELLKFILNETVKGEVFVDKIVERINRKQVGK